MTQSKGVVGKHPCQRGYVHMFHKGWHQAMTTALADILQCDVEHIPVVFISLHPKALKIGIGDDLLSTYPGCKKREMKVWLNKWTGAEAYLAAVAFKKHRHDLAGEDVCKISQDHKNFSRKMLAGRSKRRNPKPKKGASEWACTPIF